MHVLAARDPEAYEDPQEIRFDRKPAQEKPWTKKLWIYYDELVKRDKDISILVLASGTGKEGPGPLVSLFASTVQAIPVTIVPGDLSDEAVDELA